MGLIHSVWMVHGITHEDLTSAEIFASTKRTSLFFRGLNPAEKSFKTFGPDLHFSSGWFSKDFAKKKKKN
jgi:tRNA A-37 threonylcarbamoyl transferase component Bud32